MGSRPVNRYELYADGKKISIEIGEKMPKFMKRMSRMKGCEVIIRKATEVETVAFEELQRAKGLL